MGGEIAMIIEKIINKKQKAWGVVEHPRRPGHYHTGWDGSFEYDWKNPHTTRPKDHMTPCENVIITGDLKYNAMSRGHSAATFHATFRGHDDFEYELGMNGTLLVLQALQEGRLKIVDGYISGKWTIAKQGQTIFLMPYGV